VVNFPASACRGTAASGEKRVAAGAGSYRTSLIGRLGGLSIYARQRIRCGKRDEIYQTMKKPEENQPETKGGRAPHQVRLPGFIKEEQIGLGDAIKKVTYAMGIKPCVGCEKRAVALNRWMRFTG
jgi:hypothetical protein